MNIIPEISTPLLTQSKPSDLQPSQSKPLIPSALAQDPCPLPEPESNPSNPASVTSLQTELTSITKDLDSFIEKNSERSLDYMKFEAIERLATFIHQHKDMIEIAQKLEEDFLTDPKILALQKEVEWFQDRADYFSLIRTSDSEKLLNYQNQYKSGKQAKEIMEQELKMQKHEVNKLKRQIQDKKISTPVIKSSLKPNFYSDLSLTTISICKSDKEKVEYLENASRKLKNTLKSVKAEIQEYKTQQFNSRQEILPIDSFFQECYKSVYHLIFQRQSQLDDDQLTLAYKMFRKNKMELNEIKHRPIESTTGTNSHVVREAIAVQIELRNVIKKQENKQKAQMTWKEFKKLPTETVFIMISDKEIMKIIRKGLCAVNGKTFITSESKISVDQLEEFCKIHVDKLKIRTDGRGNAI